MSKLSELLQRPVSSAVRAVKAEKLSSAVRKAQYVNPDALKKIGVTVPIERPLAIVDKKPITILETCKRDQKLIVMGYLSKYPHYTFTNKIYSGWVHGVRFWFFDTKSKKTVVMSYKDMKNELNLAMKTPVRSKEIVAER